LVQQVVALEADQQRVKEPLYDADGSGGAGDVVEQD
jgi:hypothetical protein